MRDVALAALLLVGCTDADPEYVKLEYLVRSEPHESLGGLDEEIAALVEGAAEEVSVSSAVEDQAESENRTVVVRALYGTDPEELKESIASLPGVAEVHFQGAAPALSPEERAEDLDLDDGDGD